MFVKASIIIPVHNEEKLIERCLRSVLAQIPNMEIIVVNDGSSDATQRIAEHFAFECPSVRVINLEKSGGSRAFNVGVQAAKGQYIGSLGADDLYLPNKLREQVEFLDANPSVGMVFGWPEFIAEDGSPTQWSHAPSREAVSWPENRTKDEWIKQLHQGNCLFGPTALYRRELHDYCGFYDENLSILNDLDFYLRAIRKYDFHVLQHNVAKVCLRDGVSNPTPEKMAKAQAEMTVVSGKWVPPKYESTYEGHLVIATPHRSGEGHVPYMRSLLTINSVCHHLGIKMDYFAVDGDSYVDRAKNTIANRFMEGPGTDLLLIDSDEDFDAEGLLRLLVHEDEIVGGSYPIKNNWKHWGAVLEKDKYGATTKKITKGGGYLLKAVLLPSGFMRIKRSAIERFAKHYPDRWYWDGSADPEMPKRKYIDLFECGRADHVRYGEDGYFCKLWREMGGELWVEPNITIGHHGIKCWKGNLHETLVEDRQKLLEVFEQKGAA